MTDPKPQGETPRTDANSYRIGSPKAQQRGAEAIVVDYEVSAKLERELAAAHQHLEAILTASTSMGELKAAKEAAIYMQAIRAAKEEK